MFGRTNIRPVKNGLNGRLSNGRRHRENRLKTKASEKSVGGARRVSALDQHTWDGIRGC